MRDILKHFKPLDVALVIFLASVGIMTHGDARPPRPVMPRAIVRSQEAVDARITAVFPPPVSTWVSGLLLGDDRDFTPEMKEAFRRTGTSHLTAVSGYNISVLITVLGTASKGLPFSRRVRIALGILAVIGFILLTGAPASVIRAGAMSGVALVGGLLGRPVHAARALLLAICLMVAFVPGILLHDLGFQLSALATFGLVVFTEPVASIVGRYLPRRLAEPVAQTVAATVIVSPLIASTFGTFSLVTLPANVIIGTIVPYMMAVSAVLLALGVLSLTFVGFIASLLHPVFMLPLELIVFASDIPHAELTGPAATMASLALAAFVLALSFIHHRRYPYVEEA